MKYLMQRPLPGELIGSVWIRSRRRAGVGIGLVTRMITGRKFAPSLLSYAHVRDLAEVLEWDPVELLWEHSIFPYATAFVAPRVFEASLRTALSNGCLSVGSSATVQSVSDHVRFRRYCVACAQEDLTRWGESYWHREHHLPGVSMCLPHRERLQDTNIEARKLSPWPDFLPHELKASKSRSPQGETWSIALAQRSVELLQRKAIYPIERPTTWYRDGLCVKGLLSPGRAVDKGQLATWARDRLGANLRTLGLGTKDKTCSWLSLMVRPGCGIPFIPLKHLTFETLLELELIAAGPLLDFAPSGMPAKPTKAADTKYSKALKAILDQVELAGARIGVRDALTSAGCWHQFRHSPGRFPKIQALIKSLRTSKFSVRPLRQSGADMA